MSNIDNQTFYLLLQLGEDMNVTMTKKDYIEEEDDEIIIKKNDIFVN